MNKKILAFFCAVAAACSLSACGSNSQNSSSTASEPQSSSSTAESTASSDEVKDGTETLADGSILTIKGNTVTLSTDYKGGKELIILLLKNDAVSSCEIAFTSLQKEDVKALIEHAPKYGYEVVKSNGNSITIKATNENVQKINEENPSKAILVQKTKEKASITGYGRK